MLDSRAKRMKRTYFVIWLTKYLKLAKRRDRGQKLTSFSIENFARRYFNPWLNLARARMLKRQKFFELRARNLNKKALKGLK